VGPWPLVRGNDAAGMWLPHEYGWEESHGKAKRKTERSRRCSREWHGHSSSRSASRSTWESRSRSRRKRLSARSQINARDIIEACEREERDYHDGGVAGESGSWRVAEIKNLVKRLYERHNPAKLSDVASMFEKYEGMEVEMYLRICKLYNVKPHPDYASVPHGQQVARRSTKGCALRPVAKSAVRAELAQRSQRSEMPEQRLSHNTLDPSGQRESSVGSVEDEELEQVEGNEVFCSNVDCGMQMCAGINFETHPVTRQPYCHECWFSGGIYAEAEQDKAPEPNKNRISNAGSPEVCVNMSEL